MPHQTDGYQTWQGLEKNKYLLSYSEVFGLLDYLLDKKI